MILMTITCAWSSKTWSPILSSLGRIFDSLWMKKENRRFCLSDYILFCECSYLRSLLTHVLFERRTKIEHFVYLITSCFVNARAFWRHSLGLRVAVCWPFHHSKLMAGKNGCQYLKFEFKKNGHKIFSDVSMVRVGSDVDPVIRWFKPNFTGLLDGPETVEDRVTHSFQHSCLQRARWYGGPARTIPDWLWLLRITKKIPLREPNIIFI